MQQSFLLVAAATVVATTLPPTDAASLDTTAVEQLPPSLLLPPPAGDPHRPRRDPVLHESKQQRQQSCLLEEHVSADTEHQDPHSLRRDDAAKAGAFEPLYYSQLQTAPALNSPPACERPNTLPLLEGRQGRPKDTFFALVIAVGGGALVFASW